MSMRARLPTNSNNNAPRFLLLLKAKYISPCYRVPSLLSRVPLLQAKPVLPRFLRASRGAREVPRHDGHGRRAALDVVRGREARGVHGLDEPALSRVDVVLAVEARGGAHGHARVGDR